MGLWAANRIPTEDLKWNFDQGDFRYYKIDFANLKTMRDVERLMNKARKLIRPCSKYTKNIVKICLKGMYFLLPKKPDNKSWSGFQCVIPGKKHGYLTIFRQLENTEKSKKIKLKFLKPGTKIELTDLMTAAKISAKLDENCAVTFATDKAAGVQVSSIYGKLNCRPGGVPP